MPDWDRVRAKYLFRERDERGSADEPLLAATQDRGVIPRNDLEQRVWNPDTQPLDTYKLVRPGDFVISLRSFQGGIEYSAHRGLVSPAYTVLSPRVAPSFYRHYFKSQAFVSYLGVLGSGIRQGKTVSYHDFGNLALPVPPSDEQSAIADFLDRETERIDLLMNKKRRLIDLLDERRTALITQAVTKGLDPTVPMKDSGVPWIGEVPAGWEIVRLRHVAAIQTGITLGKRYADGTKLVERPYLRVANVQSGRLDLAVVTTIEVPIDEVGRYELRAGDVLMTEGGDIDKLGRGTVYRGEITGCLHQNHVFAVRPRHRLSGDYLALAMASFVGRSYFELSAYRTTNLASTNTAKVLDFSFALPELRIQNRIVEEYGQRNQRLDLVSSSLATQLVLLSEYRQALITAAVTGDLDIARYERVQALQEAAG